MRSLLIIAFVTAFVSCQLIQGQSVANRTDVAGKSDIALADASPVAIPEASDRAMRYYRGGNVLWVVMTLWSLLIPLLFLFTGFSARIRNWAQKLGRRWVFVIAIYFVIFMAIGYLIDFPLSYYQGFVREHDYGLSNQTFGKWFGDSLKGLMVNIVLSSLCMWVPYLLLRRSPRRWWLYTGLLVMPFMFLMLLIGPSWIDPLFNDFGPMKDKGLEGKILALAEKAGIEGSRVYEVNKSVDTKAVNAYMTGFLATKRIVLWDTAIAKLSEDELLSVMGHEMGHYVLGHVVQMIFVFSGLMFLALYLIHRSAAGLLRKFKHRFGFSQLSDVASFPLIILLFNISSLALIPLGFAFSRHIEREADRFALEITQLNRPAATSLVKLQQENLMIPRPGLVYTLWRATHPSLAESIDFSNRYRPWEKGEPLKYGHLFRKTAAD